MLSQNSIESVTSDRKLQIKNYNRDYQLLMFMQNNEFLQASLKHNMVTMFSLKARFIW